MTDSTTCPRIRPADPPRYHPVEVAGRRYGQMRRLGALSTGFDRESDR